jgi:hypothetical protein
MEDREDRRFMRTAIGLGVLLGLLGAAGSACAGRSGSPSEPRAEVAFTTLVQTGVPGQMGSERREVVRDAATWNQVWSELRAGSSLSATPPAVDFAREMVIVAAMATQSCVSKVTIRSITARGGDLRVDVLEEPSGVNCTCITSQRPIHAVRLPRSDAAVQFAVTVSPHNC